MAVAGRWFIVCLAVALLGCLPFAAGVLHLRTSRSATVVQPVEEVAWQPCAEEGEPVPRAGRARFGWGAMWVESSIPAGASCSVASFGTDPVPHIRKVCECAASSSAGEDSLRDELGVVWRRCGKEGQSCDCQSGVVRFGTGTRWVVSEPGVRVPLHCVASSFNNEDPEQGVPKECWCEDGHSQGYSPIANRVAMVMLTRRPPDLPLWLRYHTDYMGVEHVFMMVEDTPEFNDTWASLRLDQQQRVTVWRAPQVSGTDRRPSDDYETLQRRQLNTMARAKAEAAAMGIHWLLHIDDDELLYAPSHRRIGDILASMPGGFDQAFIPNAEAVYPSAGVQNCFAETTEINVNAFTFASYANGKAAVRIQDDAAIPAGPHMWKSASGLELPSVHLDHLPFGAPVLVVHFESCPFARWESKFWELGNTPEWKIDAIPFRFYRDSIKLMQHCGAQGVGGSSPDLDCAAPNLQQFWAKWKTEANPALKRQDLMPLNIPWMSLGVAA